MVELKVIDGIKKEEPKYWKIYGRAFIKTLTNGDDLTGDFLDMDLDDRKKLVWYGVKNINASSDIAKSSYDYKELKNRFELILGIKSLIGSLTPREFQTIFPIDKIYYGKKYGMKDYFYTRKYIEEIGKDKEIGEGVTKFLWEYSNRNVGSFEIESMSILSDIRRAEGGKGIMEEFMEEQGVTTHTLTEDGKGNEFLINNDTGEMEKVTKPRPTYLKLVK